MADNRQVTIELQSARRDAIELYKAEHKGDEVDIARVEKLTKDMYNMHRKLLKIIVDK